VAEQQSLTQQTKQIAGFLTSLTGRQKLWLGAGAALVAGLLFWFVSMLSKPEMKPLYSGLQAQDAQALGAKLAAQKIEYQISPDGTTVSVPAAQLDSARLHLASEGGPKSGRMGFELFDKTNWAGSDFSEKVNYQRALEGELERTLQSMEGVEAVRVHLVLSQESLFTENQSEAKASVILRMRGSLSPNGDIAIRRLVAGAVEKLHPDQVTVIDAENNVPIGSAGDKAGGAAQSERDLSLAKGLVQTLEPILGQGGVRASVHVEYDESSGDETQESYDPANAATLTLQKSEETLGSSLAQGIPGTASNIPNTTSPAKNMPAGADSQSSRSESATYAVNRVTRHMLLPAGRVKRITAALLVDDAVIAGSDGKSSRTARTPEELKKIEVLARATLGINDVRGDVLAIENLSFRELPREALHPPSKVEKTASFLRQWSWVLRYMLIALLFAVVYVILVRPVRKQILQSFRDLPSRNASGTVLSGDAGQLLTPPGNGDPLTRHTVQLKKQLIEKAKVEPAGASQLVQSWLREEGA
jgi:flagellar M-ring protein FliF